MEEREYKKLRDAVVKQMGADDTKEETAQQFRDVSEHGAGGGVSGFIYHRETVQFYEDNRDAIHDMLGEMIEDMGETPSGVIETLGQDYTQFANWMAWFALEEVARREVDEEDADDDDDVEFDDDEDDDEE